MSMPSRRRPRARGPIPVVAALLSAIVPGAGQLYAGARRRGWIFIAVTAGVVLPAAGLAYLVVKGGNIEFGLALVTPILRNQELLGLLLLVNALLLVFRAFAVVDAFLLARGQSTALAPSVGVQLAVGVALVGLLFVTAWPHQWVGERNLLLYDILTFDFETDPGQVTTTAAATDGPTTTSTTVPSPFASGERVNVLLMGGDAGEGRTGIRTDTMIVVSIDPDTGWTAMFGIPRNLRRMEVPPDHPVATFTGGTGTGSSSTTGSTVAWSNCPGCFPALAWDIYAFGLEHPELFPGRNSGAVAAKTLLGYLLGIDIHYFALVDLNGFVDIIDSLGGIDVVLTEDLYDSAYPNEDGTTSELFLEAGEHHLDGHLALFYARSRQQSNDFARMNRQRCVLEALAEQADPVELLTELPTIVPAIEDSVRTDVAVETLPEFIQLAAKVNTQEIVSIRFMPDAPEFAGTPTSYIADWTDQGYPIPDRDFIAATVDTALSLPPLEAIEVLNLQPLDDICGDTQP